MSDIDLTAAIEAAYEACLGRIGYREDTESGRNAKDSLRHDLVHRGGLEAALTAALPHIEQQYVKPSREEMARELRYEFGSYLAHGPYDPEKFWGLAADRILALLPGKAEAEVKAEALREAADYLQFDRGGNSAAYKLRKRADDIERGEGL